MGTARPTLFVSRGATLRGEHVVLRPLSKRDEADLVRVPDDPAWELLIRRPAGPGIDPAAWLEAAIAGARSGIERAWSIRDRTSGQLLGSTRYLNVDLDNRRLEIGATWLLPEARGTVANAESKLLQLDHAFGTMGVQRVHVQADVRNTRSRRAIENLGATFEGVLRRHIVLPDGTTRDTAVYSILSDEWASLRPALAQRVATREPGWRARPSSLIVPEPTQGAIGGLVAACTSAMLDPAAAATG